MHDDDIDPDASDWEEQLERRNAEMLELAKQVEDGIEGGTSVPADESTHDPWANVR